MGAEHKCRICGCDDEHACETLVGPCHWVEPDLCSACARRLEMERAGEHPGDGVLLSGKLIAREGKLELTEEDIAALKRLPPVVMELDPGRALQLIATLQLACRHPRFSGETRAFADALAHGLMDYLSITPNIAAFVEAGWDPAHDVPAERRIIVP